MILEQISNISVLFDIYGKLLTEKQQKVIQQYVFNNFSLGEIAEMFGTTRQAVKDLLDRTIEILNNYEVKLHLVKKFNNTKILLQNSVMYNEFIKIWED